MFSCFYRMRKLFVGADSLNSLRLALKTGAREDMSRGFK